MLSLLFKSTLSKSLGNSLREEDALLFPEFIDIVFILLFDFIEFIILLHTFFATFFSQYKKHMIWGISFSKFSDVLPAFTCARLLLLQSLKHFNFFNFLLFIKIENFFSNSNYFVWIFFFRKFFSNNSVCWINQSIISIIY